MEQGRGLGLVDEMAIFRQSFKLLWLMALLTRRFLAVVAACGFTAAIFVYVGSFRGVAMDGISRWAVGLHIGVFILVLPMYALEYSAVKSRTFFWDVFAQGLPRWVVPSLKLLGLFFFLHFFIFLVQSHAASPEIKNGEFVLNNHGRIVKVLKESEFRWLKGSELRLFATGWMFFYFVPLMYWWFPRRQSASAA